MKGQEGKHVEMFLSSGCFAFTF